MCTDSQGTGQSAQSADGKRVFILDVSVPGIAHVVLMQNLPKNKEWILSVIKAHFSSQKHKKNEIKELPIICTENLLWHNTLISKVMIKTALQKSNLFKETLNY